MSKTKRNYYQSKTTDSELEKGIWNQNFEQKHALRLYSDFDTLDETFKVAEAFVHVCKRLNIIDSSDLLPFTPNLN